MLVSVAPHSTLNPVPDVKELIAGTVVITPPAVSRVITISEPTITLVAATVIVPPAVQVNVPRLVVGAVNPPVTDRITPGCELIAQIAVLLSEPVETF